MKKFLSFLFTVMIMLCCITLTACGSYKENLWFSKEKLQECLVSDLPKLNTNKYVRYGNKDIYAKLTKEEFHSYANEIYEYLLERDFEYLGTRGETKGSLHGAFPVYYFEPASELSEFKDGGDYRFVYSDGKIKNGNGELTFCIIMINYFYPNDFYPNQTNGSTRTIKYDKNKEFEYNAIISLRFNSEAPLGGRYELHEHTCKLVGNEAGHQTVYTCGCPSPDIMELHNDNNGDYICDVCGWAMDGILPEFVPEASYFEVIDELKILDIQRIETVEYAGSVAPNIRKPIEYKTSMSATDIETVYTWLKSLQGTLTKIADEEAQLEGAGTKIFTIYTSQNYYFTISHVGRNYLNIEGGFYEQEGNIPEIVGETVTYKFESYYDEAELYIDNEEVKEYTFDFDELVCIEKDFETSGNPYKLVASIGSLYLYDEKHFIRDDIQYEIVGEFDFSRIFDDFPINGEKSLLYKVTIVENGYDRFFDKPTKEYFEVGTVITIHCYPIMDADLVMYINGERIGIQHSVEGEDGYYIWEYSFTVPEEDIVVTFKTEGGM